MNNMLKAFISIYVIIFSFGCENALRKETQNNIVSHKRFFLKLAFSGLISKKEYCENCSINKYQLTIVLNEIKPEKINLSDKSFEPFYHFISDSILTISIGKNFFNYTRENQMIEKSEGDDNIVVNKKGFKVLSEKKYEWLP
jgi:hypothetical protein